MEYIEMAAAPKGMFDKIISKDGLRVPFIANGLGGATFRPVPLPVFSHGNSLSSVAMGPVPQSDAGSEVPRRGGMPSFATTGVSLKGTQMALVSGGSGNSGGMHLQLPRESGSSLQGDELMEKGRRNRLDGGRGSRGAGTGSRKRTRAGQAESLTTSDAMPEGSLSVGAAASLGRASTGNGTRQTHNSSGEKADKSSSRRQSGQGTKRGEKKQSQVVASALNEPPAPGTAETNGNLNGRNSGILDIYGLCTRAVDISRFMVDIPLDDLISGNFEAPSFSLKENSEKMESEPSFEQQLDSVLLLLPKRPAVGEAHSSKLGEMSGNLSSKGPKYPKALLDLESPLHPEEEDGPSEVLKVEKDWSDSAQEIKPKVVADKEGSTAVQAERLSAQVISRSIIDDLPVYPFENFISRLSLAPCEPLQSLLAQSGVDGAMSGSADNRTGGDVADLCHRNGSIPPLFFSYPPVGPLKTDGGRYNHRVWIRGPTADTSGRKGGSDKEAPNGAEEEAVANSPSSRPRKADKKEMAESPDGMRLSISGTQSLSSNQVGPSRTSSMVGLSTTVKEEPRQVENAVGFSSEGNPNPMEIDSARVNTACIASSGTDEKNSVQASAGHERQRSEGDAVRPLETPGTAMDTSDEREGKLSANTLAEVKQEKVEPELKESVEGSGVASLEPGASRHETSLPPLDLKINARSPPQNDSSSSLPVLPSSPGAQAAARLLCTMANSVHHPEQDKIIDGERERRRRGFQSYPGAPAQKSTKSIRVSNSALIPGDDGREGRKNSDGGFVLPSKAPLNERRKSLSQVNDGLEKPPYSSPRNSSGGGMSTGSRGGVHVGSRSSNHAVKLEKVAGRESAKESTNPKELGGGSSSSLPPLSSGGPFSKGGQKGAKTNNCLQVANSKGGSATAVITKIPAGSTTQRMVTVGTSSRSSRTVHNGNSQASHGPGPVPLKTSRQSIPESRQKKTDVSVRGGKLSRD